MRASVWLADLGAGWRALGPGAFVGAPLRVFLAVGDVLRLHMLPVTLPHPSCPQFLANPGVLGALKTSIFIEKVIIF